MASVIHAAFQDVRLSNCSEPMQSSLFIPTPPRQKAFNMELMQI